MISVIDMPPPEESLWCQSGFEVGFFPCEDSSDYDYEPERKPRKQSAAIVRKPKTELLFI